MAGAADVGLGAPMSVAPVGEREGAAVDDTEAPEDADEGGEDGAADDAGAPEDADEGGKDGTADDAGAAAALVEDAAGAGLGAAAVGGALGAGDVATLVDAGSGGACWASASLTIPVHR